MKDRIDQLLVIVQSVDKRLFTLQEQHDIEMKSIKMRLDVLEAKVKDIDDGIMPEVVVRLLDELSRSRVRLDEAASKLLSIVERMERQ